MVHVLSSAGIVTSTFMGHSTRAASTSKTKSSGVPTKKIAKKGKPRPPIKFQILVPQKTCVCHHIDLYTEKTLNIRNKENQFLFARNSPHKAVCAWTISRLVHVLSSAGIVTSTLKVTEPGQLQHLRPNYRVCQPKKS